MKPKPALSYGPSPQAYLTVFLAASLLTLWGPNCAPREKCRPIDYTLRVHLKTTVEEQTSGFPSLSVAITSIYSARESYRHFQKLFSLIGNKCSVSMNIRYCKSYREAMLLFKSDSCDVGLVSTSLFIFGRRAGTMRLLAVPEINGKKNFQAYVIVPKQSTAKRFDDLKNSVFAFTDELSLTGHFYPLHCTLMGSDFWRKTVFAGSPDKAMDLVNREIVDGASVPSYVFDFFNANFPEETSNIRIMEKSPEIGLPPIVIGNRMNPAMASKLSVAFLSLSSDSTGNALLRSIGIDRFVAAPESLYASAERMVPKSVVP
jgi:phosphonate transport system substrate-binding protein